MSETQVLLKTLCEKEKLLLTHYQTTHFRLFQTERVCRRQSQIDENGSKLSKRVENIVGKGEITCYEQFLLFPQCFQKACFPGASKGVIVWKWVNEQFLLYPKCFLPVWRTFCHLDQI